jgi:hypothetical protein
MFRFQCKNRSCYHLRESLAVVLASISLISSATSQAVHDTRTIVFEQGRWVAIGCTLDAKDCSSDERSNKTGTGPVSTSYSIEKKIDQIQCYRQERLCVIASAGDATGFLYTEVQRFFVTRWDDRGIEANWTDGNANGEGEEKQKLSIAFASSGVDSVVLVDSLTDVPRGKTWKAHLIQYQLVRDSHWHHF